jgi:hypothetical protein
MRHDLGKDGLSLVAEGIVRGIVTMGRQFERFLELPLQVDGERDWDLIASEDVFGRHLSLAFALGEDLTKRDIWVGDVVLTGGENSEFITTLKDGDIIGWDVEERCNDVTATGALCCDFKPVSQNCFSGLSNEVSV